MQLQVAMKEVMGLLEKTILKEKRWQIVSRCKLEVNACVQQEPRLVTGI
jgi:hypothetical protein